MEKRCGGGQAGDHPPLLPHPLREMRLTHIPTPGDEGGLRRLGLNVTTDPVFATKTLFVA